MAATASVLQTAVPPKPLIALAIKPLPPGFAGQFLDSHFAQSQYNWPAASRYLEPILKADPDNADLIKRAMMLAMGAGDLQGAAARAQALLKAGDQDGLAVIILALDDLAQHRPQEVAGVLAQMPHGEVSAFIGPLLKGWAAAAQGRLETANLSSNPVHAYNGGAMAVLLHNDVEAQRFAKLMISGASVSPYDAERAGDLFAATGDRAEALKIYQAIAGQEGGNHALDAKMAAVRGGGDLKTLLPVLQIHDAAQGAAGAIFDLARILFEEQSDATARLFANMALGVDPGLLPARLLVASVLARNGRYDDALRTFNGVKPDALNYLDVEHYVADLMQQAGHNDQALALLGRLYTQQHDLDALIRMGDIDRTEEKYGDALKAYNRAAAQLGGKVPAAYWYLLYARGMTYERLGDWPAAQTDLEAALVDRPDEPYLLNYLGYGWAEKGQHYDAALKMVRRAEALKPDDGFIADSVGWILYLMGRYAEAVPQLEKAVSLTPYDATLNEHLGDAYWRIGRRLEAQYEWQRALDAKPTPVQKHELDAKLANGLAAK